MFLQKKHLVTAHCTQCIQKLFRLSEINLKEEKEFSCIFSEEINLEDFVDDIS